MFLKTPKFNCAMAGFVGVGALSFAEACGAETVSLECFSVAETRQKIASHKLADPFVMMQAASSGGHGDPIGAKLCRRGDDFVYEINLLRRDGRVLKVYVDASSGKPHPPHKER